MGVKCVFKFQFFFHLLTFEKLLRFFSDEKNWYQIFDKCEESEPNPHTCDESVPNPHIYENWYQIIACEKWCQNLHV